MITFLLFSKQVIFTNYDSDYSIQLLAGKLLLQRKNARTYRISNKQASPYTTSLVFIGLLGSFVTCCSSKFWAGWVTMETHRKIYTELSTLASLSSETRFAEVDYFSLIELPKFSRWILSGSEALGWGREGGRVGGKGCEAGIIVFFSQREHYRNVERCGDNT